MATSQHRCVFVGNIPYDATEEQLVQICEEVGPVVSFRLVIDRETGKPKGYGFCEYKDEETALSARRNLQGYEINGRQLRVDFAENDKGVDRNREQGRGGPGLTANVGGPAILGDSALHQPIGLPLAMTSASIMAGALGNPQIGSMSLQQNGLPVHSGSGSDPLTQYLAKMSRNQLYEIISEIKVMATQNKELARQLLLSSSQLPKALFQAQIMLGMVTPQALQMPNIRQSTGSLSQTQLQDGLMDQQAAGRPPHPGQASLMPNKMHLGPMPRIPETQVSALPQKALVNNQSSMHPLNQLPVQPRFQHPQQAQSQILLQPTMAGQSGMPTVPSVQPQSFSGMPFRPQNPPLATSNTLKQQIQTPLLQHPRPVGAANLGHNPQLFLPNANIQHSLLLHSSSSKPSVQSGMSILPGGSETLNKDAERSASLNNDTTWPPRNKNNSNFPLGLSEQTSVAGDTFELMNRPAKLAKLEDGRSISNTMTSLNPSTAAISRSNQVFGSSSLSTNKILSAEGLQQSEKQTPQLQFPSEAESALLQQVRSLTSEQLSSLPPEQQRQVIQLQKMLQFQSQM